MFGNKAVLPERVFGDVAVAGLGQDGGDRAGLQVDVLPDHLRVHLRVVVRVVPVTDTLRSHLVYGLVGWSE